MVCFYRSTNMVLHIKLSILWLVLLMHEMGNRNLLNFALTLDGGTETITDEFRINKFTINSSESLRFAKVDIVCSVENLALEDKEFNFKIRIPKSAFISSLVLKFDDVEIHADVVEKDKAQNLYDTAKNKSTNAGHVTQQTTLADDKDRDIFDISVNIVKQTTVEFSLSYYEFLERHAGVYSQMFYILPRKLASYIQVTSTYSERQEFSRFSFKAPFEKVRNVSEDQLSYRRDYFTRKVEWTPERETTEPGDLEDYTFEVQYELEPLDNGGHVIYNDNGDFAHYFSTVCDSSQILPKRIVFVIDISGSMKGVAMQQVRIAIDMILDKLRFDDYFNILLFQRDVFGYSRTFLPANEKNVRSAKMYVENRVVAEGSTNMNLALTTAGHMFDDHNADEKFANMIVFLTDGEPTDGVTNKDTIRQNLRSINHIGGIRCCKSILFTIALSNSPDIQFLRHLTDDHLGTLRVIRESLGSNIGQELMELYAQIQNPYYRNILFSYFNDGTPLPDYNVTQSYFLQYDCGAEIVVGGQTRPGARVTSQVTADGAEDKFNFSAIQSLPSSIVDADLLSRLVAYKTVKQLVKIVETTTNETAAALARKKALNMSLEFSFVTPFTSLIVTQLFKSKDNDVKNTQHVGGGDRVRSGWGSNRGHRFGFYDDPDDTFNFENEPEFSYSNAVTIRGSKVFMHVVIIMLVFH